jgi:hypothetical protein
MNLPASRLLNVYFGQLPGWTRLWLESCALNPEFHWCILGDQLPADLDLPANVAFLPLTLDELKQRIRDTLGLEPCIPKPYKLCDFKVAYGAIFQDLLEGYDFWGYMDLDTIWGRLSHFLPSSTFENYDQILLRGHFNLFRNTPEVVNAFRLPSSAPDYRRVFTEPANFLYDEWTGLYLTFKENGFRQYGEEIVADIDYETRRFELTRHPNYPAQCFIWQGGRVLQVYWDEPSNRCAEREFAYIHFQKRKMPVNVSNLAGTDTVAITPRGFYPVRRSLTTPSALRACNQPPLLTRREWERFVSNQRVRLGAWRRKLLGQPLP